MPKKNKVKKDSLGRPITTLIGGQTLVKVHEADKCAGEFCTIHNPSDHHMKDWPQNWRSDRGIMERMCQHGIGHPDPDDPAMKFSYERIHGCDMCCHDPRKDVVEEEILDNDVLCECNNPYCEWKH